MIHEQRREGSGGGSHIDDYVREQEGQVQRPCSRNAPGCLRTNKEASEGARAEAVGLVKR